MIKRYVATKDTTITDAFKSGYLLGRATGSNMGESDSLEVFVLYGSDPTGSAQVVEKSRILVEFPTTNIAADRAAEDIPASGSVSFYLKMGNVAHHETLPKGMILQIAALSQSWDEGFGKDLDNYSDPGIGTTTVGGTAQGLGANWINARSASSGPIAWTNQGGDFLTGSEPHFTYTIADGPENIELDITPLVESWLDSSIDNNGLAVFVTSSQETQTSSSISYYTKKFSARGSEYWFNRPMIEARWNDSKKDQRGAFIPSSSFHSAENNLNTIYFYNYIRGVLTDINNTTNDLIYVRIFDQAENGQQLTTTPAQPIVGGKFSTGIYTASLAVDTTASIVYDRWYRNSNATGSPDHGPSGRICIAQDDSLHDPSLTNVREQYEINISNLNPEYSKYDYPRLRVYTRRRNWHPNIYDVAQQGPVVNIVEDMYWQIRRIADDCIVVPFGTGSVEETLCSYDVSGSYFDVDMSILQTGYTYQFEFAIKYGGRIVQHRNKFKFKVDDKF